MSYNYNKYFFLFITAICLSFQPTPKQNPTIVLHDEKLDFTPKEFYVSKIIDERENRTAVAMLLPANATGGSAKPYPVDLQGGGFAAIKQFIDRNLPRNTKLHPVIVTLKKCMVTETAIAGGRVEGHVKITLFFSLDKPDDDPVHLVDYTGSGIYYRTGGQPQDIEPTLRKVLENGLAYIDTWMDVQVGTNIKLAKSVKLTLTDFTEPTEGDTIYYSAKRRLSFDDFQSNIANSKYDAEVFPSIGYDEHAEVVNGVVRLTLAIKVYMPKSAAWVKGGSRSDYVLNHEQRHFDIARIAAEHFKQKLKAANLPVGNYDGPINVLYLEAYREMTNLQKQYDDETRHGADEAAQARWNEKIDGEISRKSPESQ